MKQYIKAVLFANIVILFAGCASHEKFVQKYNSWVGQDIKTFIHAVGYPDTTYKLPNHNTVYVYARTRLVSYPSMGIGFGGYGYPFGYGIGYSTADVDLKQCKLYLEVNKKGKIVNWSSRGNSCVSE
ncbi:hypothetical protein [Sulfurovum sp. NBC37-1]|uniref:hypothetical protein n=1 Tax=Sulfurovum sp. (strain NBC37-1) TaxID=387093 RepID=UPI0001587D05|nr:hypothetical protein [Sulfurovum sp. NBC37-1]BAF72299.1 hypothetical protein SUN_1346 [Sulfurovum sp. NBC37-1]